MAKQQNNPGVGTEYEIYIPASFSLKLYRNKNVKDFSIRSNASLDFGNLDDVIVDIEMFDSTKYYFAIQLKHKENKMKKILPTNFEAKGDFNLEKYCKSYKKLKHKNYYFIIYTNSEYNSASKETSTNFRIIKDDNCEGKVFFDTSSNPGSTYRFEVTENLQNKEVTKADYEEFFGKLKLYVSQKDFDDVEKEVFGILKDKKAAYRYLDLFRKWHHKKFTNDKIDRETVNIQLLDIFLSDFFISDYEISRSNVKLELFERVVREFEVTVIEDLKENVVKNLVQWQDFQLYDDVKNQLLDYLQKCYVNREVFDEDPTLAMHECLLFLAKTYKIVDKYSQDLPEGTKKKLMCYFFKKPFLVDFHKFSENIIYELLEVLQSNKNEIKLVFVGRGMDLEKFSKFSLFNNLHKLSFKQKLLEEVVQNCELSLQGKNRITLKEIIACFDNLEIFGTFEIIRMLNGNFNIGEDEEVLPATYINRRVSCFGFKTEMILNKNFLKRIGVVIHFNKGFEAAQHIFEENGIEIIDINNWLDFKANTPKIFVNYNKTEYEILEMLQGRTDILYLRIITLSCFLPIMFRMEEKLPMHKFIVEENKMHDYFNSNINILCAQPGMGKSTMLKLLKNQLSNYWTVLVDLKAHITVLRTKRAVNEILNYFLEQSSDSFLENLKSNFIKGKKVVLFMDGLDELDNQCVENTLDYIEELAKMDLRIWLSSRENLMFKLTDHFGKSLIAMEEVNQDEQIKYIEGRLKEKYEEEEIKCIINKIFTSSDIINNRQVLGIPLQLYVITQIFIDDKNQYYVMTNNIFVVTKLYSIFFYGRYKHTLNKLAAKNKDFTVGDPEDYFEKYELLALQFLLDDDVFNKLNINSRSSKRFLEKIKKDKDPLGIIVKINNENKAVFDHLTYAEYFACVFLANNFEIARKLNEHLLSNRYKNL